MEPTSATTDDRAAAPVPGSAEDHAARGRACAAQGEHAQAVVEFSAALALVQEEAFASVAQLVVLLRDGQAASDAIAAQTSRHQLALVELHFERGQSYLAQQLPAQAIADFNGVVRLDPAHARAYSQRGEAYFQTNDSERAVADFREALRLSSGGTPLPAASRAAPAVLAAPPAPVPVPVAYPEPPSEPEPIPVFDEPIAVAPSMLALEAPTAPLVIEADEVEVGLTIDHDEAPAAPELPPVERSIVAAADLEAARAFYRQGEVARNNGDHASAVVAYTAALRYDPGYRLAYLNRGQTYRAQHAFEAACADFSELLRRDPGNAEALLRRGNVHADRQYQAAALADYSAALAIDPGLTAAHVNRALVHAKAGDHAAALNDADAAIQLDPTYASAYFLRGSARAQLGDVEDALADFDRLIKLEPRNALAYNERGLVYVKLGRHDQAVADFTMALRIRPRFALALYNRGVAHRLRGDHDQAIDDLSVILKAKPDHVPALQQRGQAYLAVQDHDRAVADFLAAVQIDPEYREGYQLSLQALQAKAAAPRSATPPKPAKRTVLASPAPAPATTNGFRPRRQTALAKPLAEEPPAAVEADSPVPAAPIEEDEPEPSYEEIVAAEAPADEAPDDAHSVAALAQQDEEADRVDLAAPGPEDMGATLPQNAGKLKLQCPECEMSGLFDFNQLNKLIRCRNCNNFYRVDSLGELIPVPPEKLPPGIMVEVRSGLGGWKRRWVPVPGARVTDLALPKVAVPTLTPTPAPTKTKPAPVKKKNGPSLIERTHHWFIDFRATTPGVWTVRLAPVVLLCVAVIAFAVPMRSSELRQRGEKVAKAWIEKDVDTIKQHTDPNQLEQLSFWLEHNPPPELFVGPDEKVPRLYVTVEFNDDKTGKIMIRTRARGKDNEPMYFVYFHRWVNIKGAWHFVPN